MKPCSTPFMTLVVSCQQGLGSAAPSSRPTGPTRSPSTAPTPLSPTPFSTVRPSPLPSISPTASPTYYSSPYPQATSFALYERFKGTSTCQRNSSTLSLTAMVGLETCYRFLDTNKSFVSVKYRSVPSSQPAMVNYTRTIYPTSMSCTGSSSITDWLLKTCTSVQNKGESYSVTKYESLPKELPALYGMYDLYSYDVLISVNGYFLKMINNRFYLILYNSIFCLQDLRYPGGVLQA